MTQDRNNTSMKARRFLLVATIMLLAGSNVEAQVKISGSVYGGGNEADVSVNTEVNIGGGIIGSEGNGGVEYGNVYGGGKGKRDNVLAGLVKGKTKVTIQNTVVDVNTTIVPTIYHNVYGGGAYGSVGDFEYDATTGMPTGLKTTAAENSGRTEVYIKGGVFGWNGKENGMIFGSSRGDVGAPESLEDKMAWVKDTEVKIGTEGSSSVFTTPIIKGSVYGGGENGHNLNNADVYIYSGTIGIPTGTPVTSGGEEYSGAAYPYRGNVYGGGCGTDKYYLNPASVQNPYDGNGDKYNPKAGIVQGNATVNISGGYIVHNVYGAGAMGSVGTETSGGKTTVTISGGRVGYDGDRNGNVFGAARGEYGFSDAASGLANVRESEVNISYPAESTPAADNEGKTAQLIAGSVFGGGEAGTVKENVAVNMTGGLILKDLYGGGALADTQTSNWNTAATPNTWTDTDKKSTLHTTTVRLTGGRIVEEVFGGGLGEDGKPAYVWGDVLVDLNGETTMDNTTGKPTVNGAATTNASGCVVGQLFGGNNINGTPKGDVMVHVYATQNPNTSAIATKVPLTFTEPETDKVTYWSNQATNVGLTPETVIGSATADADKINLLKAAIEANRYDVKAVYGGGNQAAYIPVSPYTTSNTSGAKTQVIIEGCSTTSIETVYGGGNAAAVPETNVEIRSAYEIYNVFGGGNGYSETDNHTDPSAPNYNPGADIGVYKEGSTETVYGTGNANAILKGGLIHEAYGGSNQKGNIKGKININTAPVDGGCNLCVDKLVGAGKNADVDGDLIMILGCKPTTRTPLIFAGADNADVNGNVELTITSGTFGQVFGGNNLGGAIKGHLLLNIEETGCNPIRIDELYLGGNQAAYSVYGYNTDGSCITTGTKVYADPILNVVSCTSIGKVFGGGLGTGAKMYADPTVNINMIKGTATGSLSTIGTIGDVFGGGNAADVYGNTTVNIGTETKVKLHESLQADGVTYNWSEDKDVLGANITSNVFGGGNEAKVSGNTYVNICGTQIADSGSDNGYKDTTVDHSGTEGFAVSIGNSVYGGGNAADVEGNTFVTMADGYVFNGIFGGGLAGSVGKFTRDQNATDWGHDPNDSNHEGTCLGKPTACEAGTGTCYVVVSGGQIGPIEVATQGLGMNRLDAAGGPVPQGWVWGAGCGIVEDPTTHPDTHFKAYVNNTDVTIKDDAFILESIIGGGEFGRVLGNTLVKIKGGQIGVGEGMVDNGKPVRYTDDQFVDPTTTTITTGLATCSHFPFGKEVGVKKVYNCYDPYADAYKAAHSGSELYSGGVTDYASDGKTWIGCVFAGGSGYMPYVHKDGSGNVTDYDWVSSAGWVEGNTEVRISGGHILTNVYGGNEYTDVKGTSKVIMTGGTVGVPRTKEDIEALPMCGYIYGAGKGDERTHFNTATNVGSAEVEVSGGIVYGSVYGGGEDGHVLGDVKVTIKEGAKIGTVGTSYFDGHVFGGGRGLSGIAQTAGSVGGNVTLNIEGGTMLGSVYGGGRLASVGTQFTAPEDDDYGNFKEDIPAENKKYGHVTVNISGGTIGKIFTPDAEGNLPAGAQYSGNVYGGSMGRLTLLNGDAISIWPKMAQVKYSAVNISGTLEGTTITRSVYGGGELGTVRDDASVTINGGTVRRDVYGGGYGSLDRNYTVFTVNEQPDANETSSSSSGLVEHTYAFTPMQFAGCVGKNTYVNVVGGYIRKSVYGGGEMASVGVINCRVAELNGASTDDKIVIHDAVSTKDYYYTNMIKHADTTKEFALSWPYEFNYVTGYEGATHVNITGGRLGLKDGDTDKGFDDNGDVYGAGKGMAGDYKDYVFCANVGSTNVEIDHSGSNGLTAYSGTDDLIAGAIYGGGEDGHVMGDTQVTMKSGFVNHSIYGGGSGKGKFTKTLDKTTNVTEVVTNNSPTTTATPPTQNENTYEASCYSITAGKVFGNTEVVMTGGTVIRNVYGGGNMGSVGKGNYAGGPDDYSTAGYGEKLPTGTNLWSDDNKFSTAFLHSGKCTVKISGGTIGYIDTTDPSNSMYPYNSSASLPYGNVFGGCRGESAPNIVESPRYLYSPEFFVGYANETEVTIEGTTTKILGSVYGGGMDGHVRRDAHVIIKGGEIGLAFTDANKTKVKTTDANDIQWLARGNVYGAGSGIGKYKYDFNYDGDYLDEVKYKMSEDRIVTTKEEDFSTSAGSVTRFTKVDIQGGTIYRNVYGGGSLASIGAPKIGQDYMEYRKDDANHTEVGKQTLNEVVISGGQIGDVNSYDANGNYVYGGRVFGGSRGDALLDATKFSTSMFTSVSVNATNTPVIEGSVFGGGEVGIVKGSVDVTMNGGTVNHDVYGGGALANTNTENPKDDNGNLTSEPTYNTTVDLIGGMINGDAYGGGLGRLHKDAVDADPTNNIEAQDEVTAVEAMVYGNVDVTLGNTTEDETKASATRFTTTHYTGNYASVVKSGRVFGCNNLNGSPKGNVTVTVNRTVKVKNGNGDVISRTAITRDATTNEVTSVATPHIYEVAAVYGGGNLADYTATGKKTHVKIMTCDVSIEEVYGGGNAAKVPATDVLVNGAHEIEHVFGGGNGKDKYFLNDQWNDNPGADIDGNANTLIKGGYVHEAYGGSNEKGTISGNITIDTGTGGCTGCPVKVDKLVGAGKNADVNGDLIMILGCKDATKIPLVYGGADNANVKGNVELTITSGRFGQVFGGNNEGGAIFGHITLNIEETSECEPIRIDELYLGGNNAAYSRYGYYQPIDETTHLPQVDANNRPVYLARTAEMEAVDKTDPSYIAPVNNPSNDDQKHPFPYAQPVLNVISCTSIGEVFGGGYGVGGYMHADPTVNINMIPGSHAQNELGDAHKLGAIGNVYGGGNAADVYGNTTINIGTANTVNVKSWTHNTDNTYTAAERTVEGAYITGNVYGGGKLANVGQYHLVTDDKGNKDEAIDIVGNTFVNIGAKKTDDTYTSVTYSAEGAQGITIGGNVFGGGKGEAAESGDGAFRCGKAMVTGGTNVIIGNGTFGTLESSALKAGTGTVYGGGEVGRVEHDTKVTIGIGTSAPDVKGDVFGAGAGKETHGYSALVRGDATVTIQGKAKVGKSVYGGGETASVGKFNVVNSLPKEPLSGGTCKVVVMDEAEITGSIFGACKGVEPDWATAQTAGHGHVTSGETLVLFTDEDDYLKFLKTLALTSNTDVIIDESAKVYGNVYGGGQRGVTLGNVDVNILGGTVSKDVYGGGALADTNTGNWDDDKYVEATGLSDGDIVTGLYTRSGTEGSYIYTEIKDANTPAASGITYYIKGAWAKDEKSALYKTNVNLLGGTISGDAYGGGLGQLEAGTKGQAGYVAPVEAKVYGDTKVNLNGLEVGDYVASIHQSLTEETPARLVSIEENSQVKEYQINDVVQGAIVNRIFGCNNLNGSPQGKAKVHVFKTQRAGQTRITNPTEGDQTAKVKVEPVNGEYDVNGFDVQAVYGGGNMAAYVPKDLTTGTTQVVIDGCDRTSIGQVYGGGNAASTPATEVTVNGTFQIAEVFGGGNGKDKITINNVEKDNPGANVGFYDYSAEEDTYNTKEKRTTDTNLAPIFISKYVYGSGKAAVNIFGGTINRVFGGSNMKGNVRLSAITMLEEVNDATGKPCCEFHVDEAYGGGKSAPMDAEAKLLMACIPGLKEVYGGAQAADVYDNVAVTITNGTFDRVFGGNNISGTIRGSITVNVEETGCRPVIIGELYGGGNLAGYSVYGYDVDTDGNVTLKESGESHWNHPQVNVKSFTSIGTIYGGGYGAGATMVGNPTVNINEAVGSPGTYPTTGDDYEEDGFKGKTITVDGHEVTLPSHKRGQIGAINNVFGGGNAAKVIGNTNVNIGTEATQTFVSIEDNPATEAKENVKTVAGVDIRGNVYGGGNNAEVTGDTNVTIGKAEQ